MALLFLDWPGSSFISSWTMDAQWRLDTNLKKFGPNVAENETQVMWNLGYLRYDLEALSPCFCWFSPFVELMIKKRQVKWFSWSVMINWSHSMKWNELLKLTMTVQAWKDVESWFSTVSKFETIIFACLKGKNYNWTYYKFTRTRSCIHLFFKNARKESRRIDLA